MNGALPPVTVVVIEPSHKPKQLTFVIVLRIVGLEFTMIVKVLGELTQLPLLPVTV